MDLQEFINGLVVNESENWANAFCRRCEKQEEYPGQGFCEFFWRKRYKNKHTKFIMLAFPSTIEPIPLGEICADLIDGFRFKIINDKTGQEIEVNPIDARIVLKGFTGNNRPLLELACGQNEWKIDVIPLAPVIFGCVYLILKFPEEIPNASIEIDAHYGLLTTKAWVELRCHKEIISGNLRIVNKKIENTSTFYSD